ncbi:MAG TPA: HNH endonuclease [Anaerolineae bacterium]
MRKRNLFAALTSLLLCVSLAACTIILPNDQVTGPDTIGTSTSGTNNGAGTTRPPSGTGTHKFGVRTKTSGCRANNGLPDPACTPGDILPAATASLICQPGYSKTVRNVPTSLKDEVYASYGIASHIAGEYEVDHLVSLELGGSNDISNLWPELASPTPGFHQKDDIENYLHEQVCSGAMSLKDAQIQIATNWLNIYRRVH